MKPQSKRLIERMYASEYWSLNIDIAYKLANESDRGAVLIGANTLDEHLQKLILAILPKDDKRYKSKLFDYPGTLSSFSGKLEMLYAFRIIDSKLYECINALRKIRNGVAHSSFEFSIKDIADKIRDIYNLDDGFPEIIDRLAYDGLNKMKIIQIDMGLKEKGLSGFDAKDLWEKRVPDLEANENTNLQLLIWKLAFGIALLCFNIDLLVEDYVKLNSVTVDSTWLSFK